MSSAPASHFPEDQNVYSGWSHKVPDAVRGSESKGGGGSGSSFKSENQSLSLEMERHHHLSISIDFPLAAQDAPNYFPRLKAPLFPSSLHLPAMRVNNWWKLMN